MEELVKQALETYFSDFKEYHIYILIGFTIINASIQIIQSMWVDKKMERFKNELKKSEIKYSKYNQLQIKALSEIYQLLSDFLESTKILKNNINTSSPERITRITEDWLSVYSKVYSTFSREKYILPASIKDKFDSIILQLNNASGYVESERKMSSMFYTWENGETDFMGDDDDRNSIYSQLEKYNKNGVIKSTLLNIKDIRKVIEMYFEKIE